MEARVSRKWQITLPEDVISQLKVNDGSLLECKVEVEKGELRLCPVSGSIGREEQLSSYPVNSGLKIQCFGKMCVSYNGNHFIFKSKKAKELLAYLLCNNGGPVKNTILAEILWPDIRKQNAMDSLYKAIRSIKNMRVDCHIIPVLMEHGEIYLDQTAYSIDLKEFEQFYQKKHDMANCAAAVEIYQGILLSDESYDWIAPYEAYFDIRFLEMAELLISHFLSIGNTRLANYYRSRIELGVSD